MSEFQCSFKQLATLSLYIFTQFSDGFFDAVEGGGESKKRQVELLELHLSRASLAMLHAMRLAKKSFFTCGGGAFRKFCVLGLNINFWK